MNKSKCRTRTRSKGACPKMSEMKKKCPTTCTANSKDPMKNRCVCVKCTYNVECALKEADVEMTKDTLKHLMAKNNKKKTTCETKPCEKKPMCRKKKVEACEQKDNTNTIPDNTICTLPCGKMCRIVNGQLIDIPIDIIKRNCHSKKRRTPTCNNDLNNSCNTKCNKSIPPPPPPFPSLKRNYDSTETVNDTSASMRQCSSRKRKCSRKTKCEPETDVCAKQRKCSSPQQIQIKNKCRAKSNRSENKCKPAVIKCRTKTVNKCRTKSTGTKCRTKSVGKKCRTKSAGVKCRTKSVGKKCRAKSTGRKCKPAKKCIGKKRTKCPSLSQDMIDDEITCKKTPPKCRRKTTTCKSRKQTKNKCHKPSQRRKSVNVCKINARVSSSSSNRCQQTKRGNKRKKSACAPRKYKCNEISGLITNVQRGLKCANRALYDIEKRDQRNAICNGSTASTSRQSSVAQTPRHSSVTQASRQSLLTKTPTQSMIIQPSTQSMVSKTPRQSLLTKTPRQSSVSMGPRQSSVKTIQSSKTINGDEPFTEEEMLRCDKSVLPCGLDAITDTVSTVEHKKESAIQCVLEKRRSERKASRVASRMASDFQTNAAKQSSIMVKSKQSSKLLNREDPITEEEMQNCDQDVLPCGLDVLTDTPSTIELKEEAAIQCVRDKRRAERTTSRMSNARLASDYQLQGDQTNTPKKPSLFKRIYSQMSANIEPTL